MAKTTRIPVNNSASDSEAAKVFAGLNSIKQCASNSIEPLNDAIRYIERIVREHRDDVDGHVATITQLESELVEVKEELRAAARDAEGRIKELENVHSRDLATLSNRFAEERNALSAAKEKELAAAHAGYARDLDTFKQAARMEISTLRGELESWKQKYETLASKARQAISAADEGLKASSAYTVRYTTESER